MTWTYIGDLEISPSKFDDADAFTCVTRVIGDVIVFNFDQTKLAGLRNLVNIEGSLFVGFSETLTDLSAFECIEEVSNTLGISNADNLLIPSGMSKLRSVFNFALSRTGATVMPTFAPDFTVSGNIQIEYNPGLKNLDAITNWKSNGATDVYIIDNASLASIEGLQPVLISAESRSVNLYKLPMLNSLAGLNGVTEFLQLTLHSLPSVENLLPLNNLEHVDTLALNDMPNVTNLQGLNQLGSVDYMTIGGCWTDPLIGMTNLKSLDGLSSLTTVGSLGIGFNPSLTSLTGADKLTSVVVRWAAQANALDDDDLAAFAAQVGKDLCDINLDPECDCFH